MSSRRAVFTSDEDNLLVKYIAKYNPQARGRSGNILYQVLCEDADKKWKWSRTHSWQSWRDRYCKRQQEFDIKIKKYQIKHNLFPANSMDEESSENSQVEQLKRKRENEKEEKRARAKLDPEQNRKTVQATESVLDKGKAKDVTNDAENNQTPEDQIIQEESFGFHAAPMDVVNQKGTNANELRRPTRTLICSPPLHSKAKRPSSPTLKSNPPVTEAFISERHKKPSITYQTSHRTVLADSQPVASSSKVQLSPPQLNTPSEVKALPTLRRRKPLMKDDVFESEASTPSLVSPSNVTRQKHKNPKLVDGPFGTRFAGRPKSADDEDDSSEDDKVAQPWPPPRKRNNDSKGKSKAVEVTANTVTRTPSHDAETLSDVGLSTTRRKAQPVAEHQPRKASLNSINGLDNGQEAGDKSLADLQTHQGSIQYPVHRGIFHKMKETPGRPSLLRVSSGPSYDVFNLAPAAKIGPSAMGVEHNKPIKAPLPRNSWIPNNPLRSADGAIARRHSMGNLREFQSSTVRRLDLRAEMVKRRLAKSSPFAHSREHSVISTASYQPTPKSFRGDANPPMNTDNIQRRRSSISIADEDREHIEFLGLNAAIEGIARESGFLVEQIWRIYDHYGSIKRTEEWIRLYRKNFARLQELTHEQMLENGMGVLGIACEQPTPRSSPLERNQERESSTEPVTSIRPSPPETQENHLRFKPLPTSSQRSSSEYSPPQETRAGEYNRLVGQGRVEEAMSREHRRASGSGGVFPRLRSSLAIWGTPSSLINDVETVERDGEGIEDEDNVMEQLLNGSHSEVEHEKDLQKEEELLFLSARAGIVDKLRSIEQHMHPDYMLRWVAARLGEMEYRFKSPSSPS